MNLTTAAFWIALDIALTTLCACAQSNVSSPPIYLYSKTQVEFDQSVKEVLFPWNDHATPSDQGDLEANALWLKDHPDVYFYVNGYASSRGELIYNLVLSQRRAEFIKERLIALGVPENRIALAVGWGQLYPVCPELNDECWSKNRRVRLTYAHQ